MTDQSKDGGPAFPHAKQGETWVMGEHGCAVPVMEAAPGMSLRDWFAGQALPAVERVMRTADPRVLQQSALAEGFPITESTDRYIAFRAYRIADAMLAERVKHADATP